MWYHYVFSTRPVYTYTLTAIGVGKGGGGEVLPLVDSFISKMFIRRIPGGRYHRSLSVHGVVIVKNGKYITK